MAAAFDLNSDVEVNFERYQSALELAHRLVEVGFRELLPLHLAGCGGGLLRRHQLLLREVLLDLSLVHALAGQLLDLLLGGRRRFSGGGGLFIFDEDLTEKKDIGLFHVALFENDSL